MCACFYRDKVEGPQSIIKSQRHGVLGSDCSKNFMGRREKKREGETEKKRKLTFKNTVRRRETVRDERGVMEDGTVGDGLN